MACPTCWTHICINYLYLKERLAPKQLLKDDRYGLELRSFISQLVSTKLEPCSILSGTMFHINWNRSPTYMEHESRWCEPRQEELNSITRAKNLLVVIFIFTFVLLWCGSPKPHHITLIRAALPTRKQLTEPYDWPFSQGQTRRMRVP